MEHDPAVFEHRLCRACKGELHEVLDLGDRTLNGFPASPAELTTLKSVPLRLQVCGRCTLAQLSHTTPADWLYRHYWYRSAVNESMRAELADIVTEIRRRVGTPLTVLDIGANDGTLLKNYPTTSYTVGVDPARNLQGDLAAACSQPVCDYYPSPVIARDRFDVITAIACCYDLEKPLDFFRALSANLTDTGVAVVQFQDLLQQLQATAFDNICHEHLEYYTLTSLRELVRHAGLAVVDVQTRQINGGSLRVWLQKARAPLHGDTHEVKRGLARVVCQLDLERIAGLGLPGPAGLDLTPFRRFREAISAITIQIQGVVESTLAQGKVIDLYGASTKGNILLQVLGLGPAEIRQAIDRSPAKDGYYTITGIPIVLEEQGRGAPADVWLCPIWQFRESVLARETAYLAQGGTIVFPLPQVEVVQAASAAPAARVA
jgi:hypothetical protein